MKEKLDFKQFIAHYEETQPSHISFYAQNQRKGCMPPTLDFSLSFRSMSFWEHPDIICLKSDFDALFLNGVISIEVDTESSVLGTIADIRCEASGERTTYTLVLS